MDYSTPSSLTIDSTLDDLPSINSCIEFNTPGEMVMQMFHQMPSNPGAIIINQGEIIGVISREAFFENTGKRFGVEVFLGRPIHLMLDQVSREPLILSSREKISQAAHEALKRKTKSVFDPIIVEKPGKNYRIIDMLTIFLAENQILLTLHNQYTFSISSGMNLTDEEAIHRFSIFAAIPADLFTAKLTKLNTITCEICGETVHYSIADVIRSYPQLSRGVEITTKMGTRSYIFYVRHSCRETIREIPVQHDEDFNVRSLRPSRLVETYV
jgi:hypothetical protein